ncbi:helix-turn-helix transcriptional regulator [Sphingomonas sp. MMS24-JH45]
MEGLAQVLETGALLRIVDPEQHRAANPSWAGLFGLTPAEIRLAVTLLNDDRSLRDAAASLGIAYGTARAQLASIFDKTQVRTQSHLLRLLTMLSSDG